MIWFSILGVLPFTLALPYANLFWTRVLTVLIGLILASAFSAIVVFAQELVPGRVGMIAGIFFGFAFGMGGIAAAVLGVVADTKGIDFVYKICSFLPLLGLLTIFLPSMKAVRTGCGLSADWRGGSFRPATTTQRGNISDAMVGWSLERPAPIPTAFPSSRMRCPARGGRLPAIAPRRLG